MGEAIERARAGGGPDAGRVARSTASRAHGNIIAPPGVPLHYPEHEAIAVFGKREEYEAALRGDPVPRFRGTLVSDGALTPAQADEIATEVARRDGGGRRRSRSKSPFPKPESALDNVYA